MMRMTVILPLIFLVQASFADTFFIDEVSGEAAYSGQSPLADVIKATVSNEVVRTGNITVNDPRKAQWTLTTSIYKLGDDFIMTLSKSNGGRVFASEKIKVQSESNLDLASERLVAAIVSGKSVKKIQSRNPVERKEVFKQFYFGFGPGFLNGLNSSKSGFAWTLGYLWGLDSQFSLKLNLSGVNASDSGADTTLIGIGGQYYLNQKKHAPYITALLGHSWSDSEDFNACVTCTGANDNGWAVEIGGGMQFYRDSSVNLGVELVYAHSFYQIDGDNPGATSLRLVLLW